MKDLRFEEFLSKAHNKYGDKFDYSQVDYVVLILKWI